MKRQGLPAIARAVRLRLPLCLLVALPIAAAVGIYAHTAPAQYDAQTTVAFFPRPTASIGADVLRVLLPRYVSLLKAQATVDTVSRETGVATSVVDGANVTVATDSANLVIVVRDTDPAQAATAANALAATALRANASDTLLQAEQVARALPAEKPSAPPRSLLTGAGILAGLIAGIAVAVLAERGRPRLRDEEDVISAASLDLIGQIPAVPRRPAGSVPDLESSGLRSAVRAIVARTEHAARPTGAPILGLTSPAGAHGKTALALAYGEALARQGRTVILLDADLVHRGLTTAVGEPLEPVAEVTDLLADQAKLEECLVPGPVPGMHVIRAASGRDAVDVLSRELPTLLALLSARADRVIVDCPAVDDEGEALLVHLPSVLLVVRYGTHSEALAESRALLQGLGPQPLGVVLTRSGRRRRQLLPDGRRLAFWTQR